MAKSQVLGALFGCAVGDAMGAPFEGLWDADIPTAEELAQGYHEYHGYPRGQFTDDTQLTLATIESIVDLREISPSDIARRIAELWRHQSVIGPGGACTQAAERYLAGGDYRTMGAPVGQAGNGTAMRTAVLGLWFGEDIPALIEAVADISRITHQDPRSIAGGVTVALAANRLATDDPSSEALCLELAGACRTIDEEFADLLAQLPQQLEDPTAIEFVAWAGQDAPEFDKPIITPFVIPTVLSSLMCILQHPTSWIDSVTAAIRLGGDVDTLGAIVGAIAGARHGIDSIPEKLRNEVQQRDQISLLGNRFAELIAASRSSP